MINSNGINPRVKPRALISGQAPGNLPGSSSPVAVVQKVDFFSRRGSLMYHRVSQNVDSMYFNFARLYEKLCGTTI